MVGRHLHEDALDGWHNREALLERNDLLMLHALLVRVEHAVLGTLSGINRVYVAHSAMKWQDALADTITVAPDDLSRRLAEVFLAPPRARVEELEKLLAETLELVEGELPGIDLSTPRRLVRAHPARSRSAGRAGMKTLLLLRHAKSDWGDPDLPDQDRPLAPRGVRAGPRDPRPSRGGVRPELVLCSSARRTVETLALVRPGLVTAPDVRIEDDLYGASAASILTRLHRVDPPVRSVLVIGHNPGLEDLTAALAGDADEAALDQLGRKFPTGALAVLEISTEWAGARPGRRTPDPPRRPAPLGPPLDQAEAADDHQHHQAGDDEEPGQRSIGGGVGVVELVHVLQLGLRQLVAGR